MSIIKDYVIYLVPHEIPLIPCTNTGCNVNYLESSDVPRCSKTKKPWCDECGLEMEVPTVRWCYENYSNGLLTLKHHRDGVYCIAIRNVINAPAYKSRSDRKNTSDFYIGKEISRDFVRNNRMPRNIPLSAMLVVDEEDDRASDTGSAVSICHHCGQAILKKKIYLKRLGWKVNGKMPSDDPDRF